MPVHQASFRDLPSVARVFPSPAVRLPNNARVVPTSAPVSSPLVPAAPTGALSASSSLLRRSSPRYSMLSSSASDFSAASVAVVSAQELMRRSVPPPRASRGPSRRASTKTEGPPAPAKKRPVAALALPPPPIEGFFTLDASAFARRRRRLTRAEKELHVSYADVQNYKSNAAAWLASIIGPKLRDHMLGGPLAVLQTPSEQDRDEALKQLLLLRASSEGAALAKVRRALAALVAFQPSDHLPASALLLNRCITSASIAALSAAKGSQGGASVASSL